MSTKTALLVIDMQKDFTIPGSRAYYDTTEKLLETLADKIDQMRNAGVYVVVIYSVVPAQHKPNPELTSITPSRRTLVEGTVGAELDERIPYVEGKDLLLQKYAPSAFIKTGLAEHLRERGIENILISGVKTNVCCRASATDAYSHGFNTFMVDDMLATNTPEQHRFHIEEMAKYYAAPLTSAEVMQRLADGRL